MVPLRSAQVMFAHRKRRLYNAVPIMAQKSLLGQAKGGAAAWQMSGLLQTVGTGIVPGNRNSELFIWIFLLCVLIFIQQHRFSFQKRSFPHVPFQDNPYRWYPCWYYGSRPKRERRLNAVLQSSFSFGQVGSTAFIVHPICLEL